MENVSFIALIKFLWILLALPLGWIWYRLNKAHDRTDRSNDKIQSLRDEFQEHKLEIAKTHFDKSEVRQILTETMKPVLSQLQEIKTDVRTLLNREHDGE